LTLREIGMVPILYSTLLVFVSFVYQGYSRPMTMYINISFLRFLPISMVHIEIPVAQFFWKLSVKLEMAYIGLSIRPTEAYLSLHMYLFLWCVILYETT
jgi:hypothetical protein